MILASTTYGPVGHLRVALRLHLIRSMADGTGTHHAGALKFGLREGFSRKRQAPTGPAPVRPASPPIEEPQFSFKKKKKFRR